MTRNSGLKMTVSSSTLYPTNLADRGAAHLSTHPSSLLYHQCPIGPITSSPNSVHAASLWQLNAAGWECDSSGRVWWWKGWTGGSSAMCCCVWWCWAADIFSASRCAS